MILIIPVFWFTCYIFFPLRFWVEKGYQRLFFGKLTLSDLPDKPEVIINTTDVALGNLFKFSKGRAWGYHYHDWRNNQDFFTGVHFPLSKAVMVSSCVPFAFAPYRMSEKYRKIRSASLPLLVDGGLYDNQGVHELGSNSRYAAKYIIVSNAGNTDLNDKRIWNVVKMLIKTSQILMKRIERMQSQQNMFLTDNTSHRYAYANLDYDCTDRLVKSYVFNIAQGLVPSEVYTLHGISEEEARAIRSTFKQSKSIDPIEQERLENRVKDAVNWKGLNTLCPTEKEAKHAKSVSTNLVGLSKYSINCLTKYAEWMTTIQVKLYLPNLL